MSLSATAAALFAADPVAIGGGILRGGWGPGRDHWLRVVRATLRPGTSWVVVPVAVDQDGLDGGLDLAASLAAGRPIRSAGLLGLATGGVLVVHRADHLRPSQLASLLRALDERRCAVLALDESTEESESFPAALRDRLAFTIEPDRAETFAGLNGPVDHLAVQNRARRITVPPSAASLICRLAGACGIDSLRAPIQSLEVARLHAALAGRDEVAEADLTVAAELVLASRAVRPPPDRPPETPPPPESSASQPEDPGELGTEALEERIEAAVKAALPPGILERLADGSRRRGPTGRSGRQAKEQIRGRTIGARVGDPRRGRLHLLATLVAAAPWQKLRRTADEPTRLRVRSGDLRIKRAIHPVSSTTVFAVDASGSAALHRLAEAKGAVESLLAESYVRRDQVALIVFRANRAEVVLPPTRSLTRARRALVGLAGGGGTPLAAGLAAAHEVAVRAARGGTRPVLVVLTDGRANIDAQGRPGRPAAEADALSTARQIAASKTPVVLIDTGPRPNPFAAALAAELGGRYLPLPVLDGPEVAGAVRATRVAG